MAPVRVGRLIARRVVREPRPKVTHAERACESEAREKERDASLTRAVLKKRKKERKKKGKEDTLHHRQKQDFSPASRSLARVWRFADGDAPRACSARTLLAQLAPDQRIDIFVFATLECRRSRVSTESPLFGHDRVQEKQKKKQTASHAHASRSSALRHVPSLEHSSKTTLCGQNATREFASVHCRLALLGVDCARVRRAPAASRRFFFLLF